MAKNINFLNNNSVANITANFERVNDALVDVLSLSGELPNTMSADLDMNGNDLLNVLTLDIDVLYIDGQPVAPSTLTTLAPNSVGSSQIIDGSVGPAELEEDYYTKTEADVLFDGKLDVDGSNAEVSSLLTNITAISYEPQTLTTTQQAQARENIGVTGTGTRQIFTATGTWTKPSGCKRVKVTVIAGGGAGGGAAATTSGQASVGAGGNGSGAAVKEIDVSAITDETVTVGLGGVAVSGAQGGDGGASSFGAHCSVPGGLGGQTFGAATSFGSIGVSGDATAGINGDINIKGAPGDNGLSLPSTALAAGGGGGLSGTGGSSALLGAGGGRPVRASGGNVSFSGNPGGDYGGGGSGALVVSNSSASVAAPGGNGASGIVIVEEFY